MGLRHVILFYLFIPSADLRSVGQDLIKGRWTYVHRTLLPVLTIDYLLLFTFEVM